MSTGDANNQAVNHWKARTTLLYAADHGTKQYNGDWYIPQQVAKTQKSENIAEI